VFDFLLRFEHLPTTLRPITTSAVLGSAAAAVVVYNSCVILYQHISEFMNLVALDYNFHKN